jgi:hypothetical protein
MAPAHWPQKDAKKMTIREFLKNILQKSREFEASAKDSGDYAKALKQQGVIEITELIFLELNNSYLMDQEI